LQFFGEVATVQKEQGLNASLTHFPTRLDRGFGFIEK
jgi:hypothetical protein